MSWSITFAGGPTDVAQEIRKQHAAYSTGNPTEDALKEKAIALALEAFEYNSQAASISVSAFGSQSSRTGADGKTIAVQSLNISISAQLP